MTSHGGRKRTKDECLRAAAHVVLMAVIRIEQERMDGELIDAEGGAPADDRGSGGR